MRHKKTIYIYDDEVAKYLEQQINQSAYIVNLIKKDMQKGNIDKETIIKIIEEYLNKNKAHSQNDYELIKSMENILNL